MAARIEQRLVGVLPVDVDEAAAQSLQVGGGGRRPVDQDAASAPFDDLAPDHRGAVVRQLHGGFHHCPVGPRPHEVARCPAADEDAEGADDDRLAGAGLPGQHVEPGPELDLDLLDDGQVPDAEGVNHDRTARRGARTPSRACGTRLGSRAGAGPGRDPLVEAIPAARLQPRVRRSGRREYTHPTRPARPNACCACHGF